MTMSAPSPQAAAPIVPRAAVIDELYDAAVLGQAPIHSGEWGLATLEVCHAILRSAAEGREIRLAHQVPLPVGLERPGRCERPKSR